jgi:hypothetical protein
MIDDQWKKKTNKDSQEKEHGQVPELVQVQVPVLEQVLEQTRSRVNQGQW